MPLEFYETSVASPSGASAGIFIPISDLPGVEAGEFAAGESSEKKIAKAILGAFFGLTQNLPSNSLGLAATRATASGGLDLTNNSFTITPQIYSDYETKTVQALPVPSGGANAGVGGVAITDIYSNAEKIAADGAISGEGFLIPSADIEVYGAPADGSITIANDSRMWFMGFAQWVTVDNSVLVRGANQASAVTAKNRGGATAITLPAAATASEDPTTDLSAADRNKISVVDHDFTITIQTKMDQAAQTFDVNVVTT